MERFTFRSTSLLGLEAELRRHDLLVEAEREQLARQIKRRHSRLLRLPFLRRTR